MAQKLELPRRLYRVRRGERSPGSNRPSSQLIQAAREAERNEQYYCIADNQAFPAPFLVARYELPDPSRLQF